MGAKRYSDDMKGRTTSVRRAGRRPATLLLCLLMLAGGASCDRFGSSPEQKPVETAPPVAKLPLPQRGEQVAKSEAPPVKPDDKATAPAAAAPPKAAPAAAALPAKELPKPKVEPKAAPKVEQKAEPKKSAAPAPAPAAKKSPPPQAVARDQKAVAAAKPEPLKPVAAGKAQPAPAEKKVAPVAGAGKTAAPAKKPAAGEKGAAVVAVKAKKPLAKPEKKVQPLVTPGAGRGWTVVVGTYLLEDAMTPDLVKVRTAGLEAVVKPGIRKKATMNRLLLAEYSDAAVAKAQLEKLKQQTSDAFVLSHGGKHAVYAGSYLLDNDAASEKQRLAAAGFSLTLKRVVVAIPSKMLTVGNFDDRNAAGETVRKLKEAGLKPALVNQ